MSSAQNLHVYYICYDQYDFAMLSLSSSLGCNMLARHAGLRDSDGKRESSDRRASLYMQCAAFLIEVWGSRNEGDPCSDSLAILYVIVTEETYEVSFLS